jgi:hypothetical protein
VILFYEKKLPTKPNLPTVNESNVRASIATVRKYIRHRQRLVTGGSAAPGFPTERMLLSHIVPGDFKVHELSTTLRRIYPGNLVPRTRASDWKERYTRHGYRFDLAMHDNAAFAAVLRSGAVEFGVGAGSGEGIDWRIVEWVFTDSLYELARHVWDGPSKPQTAFISLLVTGATSKGFVALSSQFASDSPNALEESRFRLGPLLLKREEAGTRQFQPLFDLLFQCAGFRNGPSLLP